jgi:hypothetical protein
LKSQKVKTKKISALFKFYLTPFFYPLATLRLPVGYETKIDHQRFPGPGVQFFLFAFRFVAFGSTEQTQSLSLLQVSLVDNEYWQKPQGHDLEAEDALACVVYHLKSRWRPYPLRFAKMDL